MIRKIVKRFALVVLGFFFAFAGVAVCAKIYMARLDLPDNGFIYENKLAMWRDDAVVGFVNKGNFFGYCWGDVPVETNGQGFRGGKEFQKTRPGNILRIIGVGDSVMWGAGVNQEFSFSALLGKKMRVENPSCQVINAGVVGYSTYQELLYIREYILPYEPDIVLVNHCDNDYLPTEDPFNNVRGIYLKYFEQLYVSEDYPQKEYIKKFIQVFSSTNHVWSSISDWERGDSARSQFARSVLLEEPIKRMARLCKQSGVRLIFVFIPPKRSYPRYRNDVDKLKDLLNDQNVEFVDMQEPLSGGRKKYGKARINWLWPPELRKMIIYGNIRRLHEKSRYIDSVHPSKKGNEIIAEHLYQCVGKH